MADVDVNDLSVRALRTFLLLYRTRSVSQSAELLGQDQSSVSYTLQKLRRTFSDALFVRVGKDFQPTERCVELAGAIERAVAHIDETLAEKQFVPATSRRRFTISSNYLERAIFLAPLIRWLRRHASGVTLDIIPFRRRWCRLPAADGGGVRPAPLPHPCARREDPSPAACTRHLPVLRRRRNSREAGGVDAVRMACVHAPDRHLWEPVRAAFLKTLDPESAAISRLNCASTSDLPSMLKGTDLIATAPSLLAR